MMAARTSTQKNEEETKEKQTKPPWVTPCFPQKLLANKGHV